MSQLRQYDYECVLIYDMPLGKKSAARSVQRKLNSIGAKMIQQSVWKTDDLKQPIGIGMAIRRLGGRAEILEEMFLF